MVQGFRLNGAGSLCNDARSGSFVKVKGHGCNVQGFMLVAV